MGVDDGQAPSNPLKLDRAKAIHFLTVLDRRQLEIIQASKKNQTLSAALPNRDKQSIQFEEAFFMPMHPRAIRLLCASPLDG